MNFSKMVRISLAAIVITAVLVPSISFAQDKEKKRIEASGIVLDDFGKMKESIPASLLKVTEGIIIVPKLINAGFVVGGKRGRGIAMVKREDGSWSNPIFVTLTGGSVGLQAGIQSVELVLVFKHSSSLTGIKKSSFTLGGDLSIAAGPIGRNSTANTDYKLDAEVYSYSRSKGLFAGISLNGASLEIDNKANGLFYGKGMSTTDIFASQGDADDAITKIKSSLTTLK